MKYAAVLVENEIEQSFSTGKFSNGEHSPRTTKGKALGTRLGGCLLACVS